MAAAKLCTSLVESPSSRRAWIEIISSVGLMNERLASPSSRRAWIEIAYRQSIQNVQNSRPPHGGRG